MYRKSSKGWLKHFDFILIDLISLHLAFVLSYVCRHGIGNPYKNLLYRNMAFMLTFIDFFVVFLFETLKGVLRRGYYQELAATVKHVILVMLLAVLYLFTIQEGTSFSRSVLYFTAVFYIIFAYVTRILWKKHLQKRMENGGDRSLLIITSSDIAAEVVRSMQEHNYQRFNLIGIVLVDKDMKGQKIEGIPVLANEEDAANYVCREWIDEVFLVISEKYPYPQKLADQLLETGVTVHLNLAKMADAIGKKQLVEKLGDYTVLTTSINYATVKQAFMKRSLDIIGGLAGCILTGIIFIFVAPAIYIQSPGPIFFSQIRVGKNGKKFKMYKFRSMYMDAEERKKELMKDNRVEDGMMFKLEFDPRVIGNKILPNGEKKTGIGNFIRKTSLDEFPQFLNVLKGDMSLVGTRPPTLDEWEKYELHHRARLAIKPGITGMWQVSGRSDITDFEEVVKLDMVAKNFESLINELLRSNSPKKWFRAYFNHGLINYIYSQKRLLPCDMSFDTFFIDPYGDVMPCNGTKDKEVMLLKELGKMTYFSKGSEENLKITTLEDLRIFKALLHTTQDSWIKE